MYVITGATGHIGNNVLRYLLSKDLSVHALVRKIDHSLEGLQAKFSTSLIFDYSFLDESIQENDIIIHCAAYIDLLNNHRMQTFRTNVGLTKMLIEIAKKKKCRFVYISSVDVIPKHKRGWVTEPLYIETKHAKSYYKTSKAIATNLVLEAIKDGLNGIVLYPSAVVGVHDYKPSAAGREILNVVRHKVCFSLHGGYNFIDVLDVSKAVYQAAISNINDHIILSGHEITIRELYEKIESITKSPKWIIPLPIFLVRLAIMFSKSYSQMMITTIQENYHYKNQKMIDILHVIPTPIDQTLKDNIDWLTINHPKK